MLVGGTVLTLTAAAALVSFVGSDARWLAALGNVIAARHQLAPGVAFAAAPTASWPNPLVLAELIFHGLQASIGDRGLMLAQLIAVAIALSAVARDAIRGGAAAHSASAALVITALGAFPSLSIARAQLFSLALFPLLVLLLRSEARAPSWRIWLVLPLLALWSNLHGAALLGLGIALVYLALVRRRTHPVTAVAVGIAALGAVWMTPAGLRTPDYYHGVLTNLAAQRGLGFSAPLSLTRPFDLFLIAAALALIAALRRARPARWEMVTILLLGAVTIHASRFGIWLLLFLAPPTARGMAPRRAWERLVPALATVAVAALAFAVLRGPLPSGADPSLLRQAVTLAHGTPILADDLLDEQVALAGGRIWVGNPIDAFSKQNQAAYLDWIEGRASGRRAIRPQVHVVLTMATSPARRLMARTPGFVRLDADRTAVIYSREPARAIASPDS